MFVTWRQKDRDYSEELGLYGKKTIDPLDDDLFLVGDYLGDNRICKIKACNENDNQMIGELPFVQCCRV